MRAFLIRKLRYSAPVFPQNIAVLCRETSDGGCTDGNNYSIPALTPSMELETDGARLDFGNDDLT